jgi:hypothetical protein
MIDRFDRPSPRFPAWAEHDVRSKIRQTVQRLSPLAAVSSAACGGDILFAEEILEQGIPLYVILPFQDMDAFVEKSVAFAGHTWIERFRRVCARAALAPYFAQAGGYRGDIDLEENHHSVIFFAQGYAAARHSFLVSLVLYDGTQPGGEIGGTRRFLDLCNSLQIPYEVLDIAEIRRKLRED